MSALNSSSARPEQYRIADRFDAAIPLALGDALGEVRNISDTGLYFEIDAEQKVGSLVNLTLEFQLGGKPHRVECKAQVVRISNVNGRVGVGARLLAPLFASEVESITL
jgi:hypothetical protein